MGIGSWRLDSIQIPHIWQECFLVDVVCFELEHIRRQKVWFSCHEWAVWSLVEGSVCHIYPLQRDIPSPCMLSKQSMGWHFDTSYSVTTSNGDTCLNQLLHWCLENGDFLIILHLLAGIFFQRNFSFQFCPPFLVKSITMDSCILIYLLCYNQLVILPCVQIS